MKCRICKTSLPKRLKTFCSNQCRYKGVAGKGNPRYGVIMSGKLKKKISKVLRNMHLVPPNKGVPMSKEQKIKLSGKNSRHWKGGKPNCADCGIKLKTHVSTYCRDCMHKGSRSHWWKGGITETNFRIRTSKIYKEWRNKVFKRDNYTCQLCGARSCKGKKVKLNADHIKPFALFPKLRFKVSNGRTLCEKCHRKTPTYGSKVNKRL